MKDSLLFLAFLCMIVAVMARETVGDAANIARHIVDLSDNSIGTMATVFPSDHPTTPGLPFALQEYYASCHQNGSLTLLFFPISRHSQNILGTQGHSVSITVTSSHPAARSARVSLLGSVTVYNDIKLVPDLENLKKCYLGKHRDARWWLPDDERAAHVVYWAIFDPHTIYFVGGFGDKHYIGYIPAEMYRAAGTLDIAGQKETTLSLAGRLQVAFNAE